MCAGNSLETPGGASQSDRLLSVKIQIPQALDRLCYRYPSLLVDAVVEHEPGRRVVAVKNVTVNEEFFQGSLNNLREASAATSLPCLRKDFIVDKLQILEARAHSADAILLIVAILSDEQLQKFHSLATEAGLTVLVEVHDEQELERTLKISSQLLGVNNRDLKTFKVDLATTEKLAKKIPAGTILVAESGIHNRADVERLKKCGAKAILVGESLLHEGNIQPKVRELIG